jgi:molybdate-binding protein
VTNWQAGLTTAHGLGHDSVARVLAADVRWIGREPGSGARQVQDELLQGGAPPSVLAKNHAEVADAIRSGLAGAGVSIRLVAEEAGLDFISVREEAYDLCMLRSQEEDPRLRALVEVVRSLSLRALLRELPGYDVGPTGDMT